MRERASTQEPDLLPPGAPPPARPREDRWFRVWTTAAGIALAAWVFLPFVTTQGGDVEVHWLFELVGEIPFTQLLVVLLVPTTLVGVCLVAARLGSKSAPVLFWIGVAAVAVLLRFGTFQRSASRLGGPVPTGLAVTIVAWLSATALAAANHVRKAHPGADAVRLLTGIGGAGTLLTLLFPWYGDGPLVASLVDAAKWAFWGGQLCIVGLIAYGALGIAAFRRWRKPIVLCRATSAVSRLLLLAMPGLLILALTSTLRSLGPGESATDVVLVVLKFFALLYGIFFLPALGLAGWMGRRLAHGVVTPEDLGDVFR